MEHKTKKMKVETIRHADVKGRVILYLKLTNKTGTELHINVGEKTVKTVENLLKEDTEQLELDLQEKEKTETKDETLADKLTKAEQKIKKETELINMATNALQKK